MSLVELLPSARALSADEKFELIREMTQDLAKSDPIAMLVAAGEIPMWSPIEAYAAAAQLEQLLDAERAKS
jgi:hypothetical protein